MENNKKKGYGMALNIDPDCLAYMYGEYKDDLTTDLVAKLEKWYDDRYADCGISDILYNINWQDYAKKYLCKSETLEDGTVVDVDYSSSTGLRAAYLVATQTDVDPYDVWFDKCRKDGVNVWLSFRMNDVHYANERTGHSEFFYKAKRNGWLVGSSRADYWQGNISTRGSRAWYPNALNYAIPEVRKHFVDIIDEQMDRYDAYGIELDWQRSIWCFPEDSLENIPHMNALMKDINAIVAKYEKKYGHPIKIMARISRGIDENRYFGFDVREWAENDWVDVIVPSPYWGVTDTAIPVAEWKSELAQYPDIEIWPGVECHVMINSQWQSAATLAAQTASYLSAGADKMYLYNLFNDVKDKFRVCASVEDALSVDRSYMVTRANTTPVGCGFEEYHPLPVPVTAGQKSREVLIWHGPLVESKATTLYIGISGDALGDDTLEVYYNGVKCSYAGASDKAYIGASDAYGAIVGYAVPAEAVKDSDFGNISFTSGTDVTVGYIELAN